MSTAEYRFHSLRTVTLDENYRKIEPKHLLTISVGRNQRRVNIELTDLELAQIAADATTAVLRTMRPESTTGVFRMESQ